MKPLDGVRIEADWLSANHLQTLFDVLTADGGEAMVAGGAVRNSLMQGVATDVDLSTTLLPEDVISRLEAAGHKGVPTGIDHGTVTAVIEGSAYEVTTLREDIETDGRHAVVRFGTDWQADAERRDLTINALYCDREGRVFDLVGGYEDIQAGCVRFIGEATDRIREDALRILRFFRFFAWYGHGRPDASGLKACTANRELLSNLSAERIWQELKKLLAAHDPGRALLWMRTTGVLEAVLPESAKWGIDAIPGLMRLEQEEGYEPDAMLRLMAMIRPHGETAVALAKRLAFSNVETERLEKWAGSTAPAIDISEAELEKLLYRSDKQATLDAMKMEAVHLQNRDDEKGATAMREGIRFAINWRRPEFPVKGRELIEVGFAPGPEMGKKLATLEEQWVESGFKLSKAELLGE